MSSEAYFNISEDYEIKLLTNLVHDESFLIRIIDIIKKDYFTSAEAQWIFEKISSHFREKSALPSKEVFLIEIKKQQLRKTVRDPIVIMLHKMFDLKSKYLIDADEIKEDAIAFCQEQAISNALIKSAELLKIRDFSKIRRVLDEALLAGQVTSTGIDFDNIEDRKNNLPRKNILPLPWEAINSRIGGGMGEGEFLTFVAPMGAGKTMIASILASYNRTHGSNTLVASLELDSRKIRHRIDSILTNNRLDNSYPPEYFAEIIKKELKKYPDCKLYIEKFPPTGTTANTLKTKIRILRSMGFQIDWLIVDYLDVMDTIDPAHNHKKDWEKQEHVSRDLYTLASDEKLRIVGLVQGNTTASDAEVITVKTTAGGAKRLHPADIILGYARPDTFKLENKANISFIKNRFGRDGYVLSCKTDYNLGKIEILDEVVNTPIIEEEIKDDLKTKLDKFKKKRGYDNSLSDII